MLGPSYVARRGAEVLGLVHQAGGAKGAFGGGALKRLDEAGFRFGKLDGVSVGALNTAAYAKDRVETLERVWHTVTEKQVFERYSFTRLGWRLATGARSLYSFAPLRELLLRELGPGPYNTEVGAVSLRDGGYVHLPGTLESVYASACMPVFAEPVGGDLVDGGVRHVTPLAEAIDAGVAGILVLLCSPRGVEAAKRPRNIVEVAMRTLDLVFNQVADNDIRITAAVNELCYLATLAGLSLPTSPSGQQYRYVPICVLEPPQPLGETLDFSRPALERRWTLGYETADHALRSGALRELEKVQ